MMNDRASFVSRVWAIKVLNLRVQFICAMVESSPRDSHACPKDNMPYGMRFVRAPLNGPVDRFFAISKDNLGNALTMEELDSSNGILFPFYDEDTNLIFLCGKVRLPSKSCETISLYFL